MKTRIYSTKNISNIRQYLNNLFRIYDTYLLIHVSLHDNNNKDIYINSSIINCQSVDERISFINKTMMILRFVMKNLDSKDESFICFEYCESNRDEYLNAIEHKKLNMFKYLENKRSYSTDANKSFTSSSTFWWVKRFYSTISTMGKRFYSTKYIFHNAEYPIPANSLLTDLKPYFNKFINENKAKFINYISVICQVREVGNIYYTIGDRFPIDVSNPKDLTDYLDFINNKWAILDSNQYDPSLALSVLFNYTNISYENYSFISNKFKTAEIKKAKSNSKFDFSIKNESELPLNTYYTSWGESIELLDNGILRIKNLYIDSNNNLKRYIEVITLSKADSQINLFSSENNIKITTFIDKIVNNIEFIRIIGNKTYYIKNNLLSFAFDKLVCDQFISKVKPAKSVILNIMTLDIETYVNDNKQMNIYCISTFEGLSSKSYYITNYIDTDALINDVLKNIFIKKYSGKSIYIHNSSEFDMIFLYNAIINYTYVSVKPIIKDGKFINLEIEYGNVIKYKVYFKDSYLLLMASLDKLSKTFNVNYKKDIFPYKFVNKNNLNYIGNVPSIEFFDLISITEYDEYKSRFNNVWSLKYETIKYCELDCKALYEVINNFAYKIFSQFKIDISTTPTLPSAAMKTYRTSFIPKDIKIAKIGGKMFDNIHNAFYGGHVDMYIPTNPINTKVYGYDVNSLYPYVKKTYKYPYQYIAHFIGDITSMYQYNNLLNKCVGYYKVIVTAPDNLGHPILPKKVNNTTVYGVGSWVGWYYSEELKNAVKYGYTYDILEGYRTKYLGNKIIPILDKKLYDVLVNSYYGGHVDCYIPESNPKYSVNQIFDLIKNNNTHNLDTVKHYDVNSLYPSVMKNYMFPTDILGYFIGDITLINGFDHHKFGIYKVSVNCPKDIQHPILPFKQNGRTIYPTGKWTGWYNNLELDNAKKYGYTFNILEGYLFDTADLFSDFVNDLYLMKQNSSKSDPIYLISKLLMNSLYGKFGINPHLLKYKFITKELFENNESIRAKKENYKDWVKIGNYYLVGYEDKSEILSNVAIAQTVTSFSRIVMSSFKNNQDIKLYYSDTDSIIVDKYLSDKFVSNSIIGLFKLEDEYLKFIALAPKVYGAINKSGYKYTKVKGFKDKVPLEKLELLLNKNYKDEPLNHKKWFKDMNSSTITIRLSQYDLKINDNKRIAIYENNKFSKTESIVVNTI